MTAIDTDIRREKSQSRKRVLMRGTLYAPNGAHVVWVRDVSREGALVSAETDLPLDSDIIFKRGPLFVAGRIAWVRGNSAGLNFYRQLEDDQLLLASAPNPSADA